MLLKNLLLSKKGSSRLQARKQSRTALLFKYLGIGVFCCLTPLSVHGQGRPGGGGSSHFAVPNIPQEEAKEILERFRGLGLENDFSLNFYLKHLPRRGDEIRRQGRLWGTFTPEGPITLFEIYGVTEQHGSSFLLVRNGVNPQVWWSDSADQPLELVPEEEMFKPLIEGLLYSAFDAMMPFIFWQEASYRESKRVLGRRAHIYEMQAPESFRANYPDIRRVDMALDAQFDALLQASVIGEGSSRPLRTFNVLSFKKAGEQYLVGETEMREETSRDRTILEVTSAALNIRLPKEMFEGNQLPIYPEIPVDHYISVR